VRRGGVGDRRRRGVRALKECNIARHPLGGKVARGEYLMSVFALLCEANGVFLREVKGGLFPPPPLIRRGQGAECVSQPAGHQASQRRLVLQINLMNGGLGDLLFPLLSARHRDIQTGSGRGSRSCTSCVLIGLRDKLFPGHPVVKYKFNLGAKIRRLESSRRTQHPKLQR